MNEPENREEALFNAAAQLENPHDRAAFLDAACSTDVELRHRLNDLFTVQSSADAFFEQPGDRSQSATRIPNDAGFAADEHLEAPSEGPGTLVGRYKLLEKIGEGGFGVVYMAEQREPVKRRVALKIIKLGMDTLQVVARFEAERQALALMDHPNIAKVFDAGATESGRPYFVMELVRGVPITQYCDENNLPASERLQLFIQVCRAIQHAHQKGIIHRDIKPSNILVTLHDGVPVPKVIDFGIAKATQQELTEKTVFTRFQQFMGTPAYISPEQAELSGLDVDTRSDVYSLGVLLYELLTGKTPFNARELLESGLDEMRRIIREKEPPRPSTRLTQELVAVDVSPRKSTSGLTVPTQEEVSADSRRRQRLKEQIHRVRGDLDWIVMKCLEKDRTRRYGTAYGLIADIQRHLDNEPVEARPPSQLYRLQKFARRNKLAFAAVAVLVLGAVVSTSLAIRATKAETAQRRLRGDAEQAAANEATQRERAEENLYASDMRQAFQCLEKDEVARALGLLNRHRPKAGDVTDRRGFEWRYLWKLCQGDPHEFLEGVEGIVWWLEWSPGGEFLAAGLDREVTIFDMPSKTIIAHLDKNTASGSEPRWAVFTPDGKTLITASHDRVKFFETTHWTELPMRLPPMGGPIALSPDGNSLVTMPSSDYFVPSKSFNTANNWDLRTLQVSRALTNVAGPLVFSPDGKRLATDTREGIKLWPLNPSTEPALLLEGSSNVLGHFTGYDSLRRTVAFSPDGHLVAAGSSGGKWNIMLWDAVTGQRLDHDQLHGHLDSITGVAFSRDSRFLASAGFDSTIRIWEIATLKLHRKLRGQLSSIWSLIFAPDGQGLVSGGEGNDTIKVWPFDGTPQVEQVDLNDRWSPVWLATNGMEAITFDDEKAEYWNTGNGQLLYILPRPNAPPIPPPSVAMPSPDGHMVFAGYSDGAVRFASFATGDIQARTEGHTAEITALAASPDGKIVVSGGRDLKLCWWEMPSMRLIRFNTLSNPPSELAFSPDGKILVSTSEDAKLSWWDTGSGQLVATTSAPALTYKIAFSPDGKTLTTLHNRRTQLWDVSSRTPRPDWVDAGRRVAFSPNSHKLLSTRPLELWDVSEGRSLGTFEGHKTFIFDSVFSPDGRTIASSANDVRLWSVDTQQEMLIFTRPGTDFDHLLFSADGSTLVAGSASRGGGGLRVWRAPSFQEIEAREKASLHNH